jgi:hypothetical protein
LTALASAACYKRSADLNKTSQYFVEGKVLLNSAGTFKPNKVSATLVLVEHPEPMDNCHIHLVRASVEDPARLVEVGLANEHMSE